MRPNRSVPSATVIPELAYADVLTAAAWLCRAFGFQERLRIGDHRVQLLTGEGAIVVMDRSREPSPDAAPRGHAVLVRVESVDAHYARAVAAGAEVLAPPTTHPFGERQYGARDLGGHHWTFSETVSDVDPASWGGTLVRPPHEAAKPNPALAPLGALVGSWNTVGTHPLVPGTTFHGRTSFAWIEGGAFLIMRSQIDEPEVPSAIAVFGTDDATGECSMLYFDERGVSRRYEVGFQDDVVHWWRDAPDFSQRCTVTIAADRRTMVSRGEMSRDGAPWEPDLALTYTRAD